MNSSVAATKINPVQFILDTSCHYLHYRKVQEGAKAFCTIAPP